uniref:Zinc finger-containing ubiquitin peptidase 1 n=1 Tax=Gouania willdenowi TaxID=441366 RepID=A0A8C5GIN7_GOUWI
MLTCEICGEEVMLEEEMKTHLLLSHQENDMHCPLCSLSGVSYDELCYHITSAHPEEPQSTGTNLKHTTSTKMSAGATARPGQKTSLCHSCPHPKNNRARTSALASCGCASAQEGTDSEPEQQPSLTERPFSCPMCSAVFSNTSLLQEHVELHLQGQCSAEDKRSLACPMCSVMCSDSSMLQEHVELHLDQSACGNTAESPCSDLKMAIQLQQAEDESRKYEEEWQERKEFKKLQRQFGLDGAGGYSRQMERTMEKAVSRGLLTPADYHSQRAEMMESLALGIDDGKTTTKGVMSALYDYYQSGSRDHAHVNFQMLLSSLHRIDGYAAVLHAEKTVPSIPRLQSMIEEAWKEGLDPQGASHFKHKVRGTRAWIGATEIYALLTSLRVSARIIDFHQTGPGDTHPRMVDWVKQYFISWSRSGRRAALLTQTSLPPLYLQYQGHSCSIVGLEQKKNGALCVLLLDPASSVSDTSRLLHTDTVSSAMRHIRKFPRNLKHRQYQVVAAQGLLSAQEKQASVSLI